MYSTNPKPRETLVSFDKKATIYYRGGMGNVVRMIVKSVKVERGSWAQYSAALFVTYREPRKRKDRTFTQTDSPNVLIIAGVDTPDPAGIWDESSVKTSNGTTTARGRYMSCDDRWQSDFDKMINEKIKAGEVSVIFDARAHNSHD